jgi:hypothetical protein
VASVARSRLSSTSLLPEITPYSVAGASWLAISWPVWLSSWRRSWIRTKVKKLINSKVSSSAGPRLMSWVRVLMSQRRRKVMGVFSFGQAGGDGGFVDLFDAQ